MLRELNHLPPGLLQLRATELLTALGGPTLIHLPGRREPALFLSVLMHGNETVGWEAIRELLALHGDRQLPRALSLFIGNLAAAAQGLRRLEGQPDYNRVWPGSDQPETPEHRLMRRVVEIMRARGVFASVDVHNNTGLNPHYACVNRLDHRFFHLATLFSRTVVYFLRPLGVQSMALADLCPAVTLECGKVGQARGVDHARDYIDACLHLAEHSEDPVAIQDIDLFHTVAQVRVPPGVSFGFGERARDIRFAEDLDRLNFRELPAGTTFGCVDTPRGLPLEVRDEQGRDVAERYFEVDQRELRVRLPVMPSMLTTDCEVIRQDCLCYLMERFGQQLAVAEAAD
jgi:succinylglutamate desuccinylase